MQSNNYDYNNHITKGSKSYKLRKSSTSFISKDHLTLILAKLPISPRRSQSHAAGRFMRDLNTLANISKHRGMLTNDIPARTVAKPIVPGTRSPV